MTCFFLLATVLASAAGFFNFFDSLTFINSFGILETASAAFLVCACLGFKKTNRTRIALTYTSSFVLSVASAALVCFLTQGASSFTLPATWLSLSQTLDSYIVALPIILCLTKKKDPITTALWAISAAAAFILITNCLNVFVTYDHFGFDAFDFFISDMSNEYLKAYEGQNLGVLAEKVYASFMTRISVSLLPGICIMLAVIQIFVVIAALKLILKEKLLSFHKGPWAVSLSLPSAIINIICIIAFMSCFFSTSVTTFTAVAGNIMLIFAPASAILGFAFIITGTRKGGFINLIFIALPILMLFLAPEIAIIYISFLGSSNIIFNRIAASILKVK